MDTRDVLSSLQTAPDVKTTKEKKESDWESLINDRDTLLRTHGIREEDFIEVCYDIYRLAEVSRHTSQDKDIPSVVKKIMELLIKKYSLNSLIHFAGAKDIIQKWVCWELAHPGMPLICRNKPLVSDIVGLTPERINYICSKIIPIKRGTQSQEKFIMSIVSAIRSRVAYWYDSSHSYTSYDRIIRYKDIVYYAFAKETALQLREKGLVQIDISGQLLIRLIILQWSRSGVSTDKEFYPPITVFFQQPSRVSESKPDPVADLFGVTPAGLKALCRRHLGSCGESINMSDMDSLIGAIITSLFQCLWFLVPLLD